MGMGRSVRAQGQDARATRHAHPARRIAEKQDAPDGIHVDKFLAQGYGFGQ
jgi:hypothetical protein